MNRWSVSRVLSIARATGRSSLYECSHPHPLAAYPRRLFQGGRLSPHIWPCSSWGLPCRSCCQSRGGLLPHLFTLTDESAVCFLWPCPSRPDPSSQAQELPGSLSTEPGLSSNSETSSPPATVRPT